MQAMEFAEDFFSEKAAYETQKCGKVVSRGANSEKQTANECLAEHAVDDGPQRAGGDDASIWRLVRGVTPQAADNEPQE
jgi:hypothetical protein